MKKKLKRTLAMIMSLSMLATTTAFTASAEEVSSDNVETISTDSKEATTADSEEVNISADKCLGYQVTSDEYKEFLKKQSGYIDWIEYSFSFFDTLEIDDGYSLDDVMDETGWFCKSNHFKATGTWGDNVEWVYDHGKLTISGTGDIMSVNVTTDYMHCCGPNHEKYPWSTFATNISEIDISDGITYVPFRCFEVTWRNLKSIKFGADVKYIQNEAIDFSYGPKTVDQVDLYFPEGAILEGSIFKYYEGNLVIHGYANSAIDYYLQEHDSEIPNYKFERVGRAKTDYYDYRYNKNTVSSDYLPYDFDLDGTLDINNKTLKVTSNKVDDRSKSALSSDVLTPSIVNGELSYDDDYCKYVEKLYISDNVEEIVRLKEFYKLKEIYVPNNNTKLPWKCYLPNDRSELTIIANKGSKAEKYAKEYGIKFVDLKEYNSGEATLNNVDLNSTEPTAESTQQAESSSEVSEETAVEGLKLGDVNLDGDVTIADAVVLNKYLVGSATLSESAQKNADCDKDGNITSSDTLTILKYVIGSIDEIN